LGMRKQKNLRLRSDVLDQFTTIVSVLGLRQEDAAEQALYEWTQRNKAEAQKRLDLYAERGVEINLESCNVNIAILQKTDVILAKEQLKHLLEKYEIAEEGYERTGQKLALLKNLQKIRPILVRTRDPELAQLVETVTKTLEAPAE